MRIAGSLAALALACLIPLTARTTTAAAPAITITSPANGSTVRGTALTVSVTVANFRLVRPVFSHPPVLKGFAGSLQYILDGTANYVPRRDLSAATTHTWTNVAPGAHTVLVRFATSQHLAWPGGPLALVNVRVAAVPAPTRHHAGGASPGVGAAPTTGGGSGLTQSPLNLSLVLLAALLIILGLLFVGGRFAFATGSGQRLTPSPAPPDASDQALSVLPAPGENPDSVEENVMPSDVFPAEASLPASDTVMPETAVPAAEGIAPESVSRGGGESEAGPVELGPESPAVAPHAESGSFSRDRAVEMARQWPGVVEGLVRQLDEQEAERRRMLDHIRSLEERMRSAQTARDQIRETTADRITADDFQTLRYLTDALTRDPDHIVNLAAVAQHATKFHELVEAYARLQESLSQI